MQLFRTCVVLLLRLFTSIHRMEILLLLLLLPSEKTLTGNERCLPVLCVIFVKSGRRRTDKAHTHTRR